MQEAQKAEESQPFVNMVLAQYHDFRDVFSKEAFDKLPLWKAWDHAIDLTPGAELPCPQTFPLSPAEQKELDDFLPENLSIQVPYGSPCVLHQEDGWIASA